MQTLEHLYEIYQAQYQQGLQPTTKTLLYHEDEKVKKLIINVTMFPFELSQRWDEKLENIKVLNVDTSIADVTMSLYYFKLRKLKKMFEQNQQDMQQSKGWNDTMRFIEIHKHLKNIEREITQQLGTVIIK